MEQQVMIELQTTIEEHGTEETITVKEQGRLYTKDHLHMIQYDEELENQVKVKNMITIQRNKVSIRRSGDVKMNQLFREGKRSENIYQHPHGRMHMDTFTKSINYQPFDQTTEGKLSIHYTVKLNGQPARTHWLTLTLTEQ